MIKKIREKSYSFLRKTQKFTETDNVYIAKHGTYLTLGNFITMAAAFLFSVAVARLLPKEIYGQYKYILSLVALISITSLQGINTAVVRGVAQGFEKTVKQGFKTKLKWSLLGSLISLGLGIYFMIQGNPTFSFSFLIVAIFLPLTESGRIYQSYLDGKKIFNKRVKYTTIVRILSTIALIITLLLTKKLIILILVYFLSETIFINYFLLRTLKKYPTNNKQDNQAINYGKHLSLMSVINTVSQNLDMILVFNLLGPVQLAVYSFAVLPIKQLRKPFLIIKELAFPKFSVRSNKDIKRALFKKLLKTTSLIIVPLIIIYIIFAPYLYGIFFPQYMDSVFYSRIFSLDLLIFPASMMALVLQAKKKTAELYKINALNPIVQIALLILLVPIYGILGIILAKLLSNMFYSIIVYLFFKHI